MKDKDWFGKLPNAWTSQPLKYFIDSFDAGAWGEDIKDDDDDCICIRVADFDYPKLHVNTNKELTRRNYDANTIAKLRLHKGDILVEKSGGGEKAPVGRAVIFDSDITAVFANFIARMMVSDKHDSRFITYGYISNLVT